MAHISSFCPAALITHDFLSKDGLHEEKTIIARIRYFADDRHELRVLRHADFLWPALALGALMPMSE